MTGARRKIICSLAAAAALTVGAVASPGAGAATISPPSWDFGTVGFSDDEQTAHSAPQLFTVTLTETVPSALVGFANVDPYDLDFIRYSQTCEGLPINAGTTCTVGVYFAPTQDGLTQTFLRVGYWSSGNHINELAVARLSGTGVDLVGEGGGRKGGGGPSAQAIKKCKKIKDKAKRKKCLKKQGKQQGGGGAPGAR
jgi:hypothetical protein